MPEFSKQENQDNPEFREKSGELFSAVKRVIQLRSGSSPRALLSDNEIRTQGEVAEFEKNIETPDDFFSEIKVVDNNILEIEKRTGYPIDLSDPQSIKTLLAALPGIQKDNLQRFETELDYPPEADSPAFFWALRYSPARTENIELNWPAKVDTPHLFAHRIVGRYLINELKKGGILMDEGIESLILKALPFVHPGNSWETSIKKDTADIKAGIEKEQQKALGNFYGLEQLSEISKIAKNVSDKLILIDLFRYPDETVQKEAKSMDIDSDLFGIHGEELKKIIRGTLDNEEHIYLFGHALPYASQALDCFYKKFEK